MQLMKKPRVAILGASGIGRFHAREFNNSRCEIIAILGSTKESSIQTAERLERDFRIKASAYYELEILLKSETLDAVSICTPPELHSAHVRRCLENGLNILCEKPFVLDSKYDNYDTARDLMRIAREKGKILTVNTQWPSVIPELGKYMDLSKIETFSMSMEPVGISGIELLVECIPHMNSMLIKLLPCGNIKDIKFFLKSDDAIDIKFDYHTNSGICKVSYFMGNKKEKPTKISFSINNEEFSRIIGKDYRQQLVYKGNSFYIDDPLMVSIRKFVSSLSGGKCLIGEDDLLQNVRLQDIIAEKYLVH